LIGNKLVKNVLKTIFAGSLLLAAAATPLRADYQPMWTSLAQHDPAPEWFQDAKFGVYFHWGVFSVPAYADEWYPRRMYNTGDNVYAHHLAAFGNPFSSTSLQYFPYNYFITGHTNLAGTFTQFAPVLKSQGGKWDPTAWAQLFATAGAKFAGPVAEHHDGYSMWNSSVNEWNSVNHGPHQDLAAIWSSAIRGQGMKLMMAIHTAYNYNGFFQYAPPQTNASLQKLFGQLSVAAENQLWEAKLKEVIDGYHPDIIYQDFTLDKVTENNRLNFLAYYYNQAQASNQSVIATYKDGLNLSSELYDFERGGPDDILYPYWLTDESVSPTSWCYTEGMTYYATNALLHELLDRVSKNGNLVLNIAPKPDGTIPVEQQAILQGFGDWLSRFGEGVYSNRAWTVYGEGPTTMGGAQYISPVAGTSADIRFMRNKATNVLYAMVMNWPGAQFNIKTLNALAFSTNNLTSVQLLGATTGTYLNLPYPVQDMNGLKIALPSQPYSAMAYVFKLNFAAAIPPLNPAVGYIWSAPVAITTADATLNQPGNIVGAACFGATATSINVTLTGGGSVRFYGDGSVATCTGSGTATGAFPGTTGNANFNSVLNGFTYDNGPHTITLKNLIPGQLYSVQLFALDNRNLGGGESTRLSNFSMPGNSKNVSATFAMGNNVSVTGMFVAVGTNMVIQQNLPSNCNGNLNALVVRALTGPSLLVTAPPQSGRANSGGSASLSARFAGTAPINFTWQAGAAGSGIFTNIGSTGTITTIAGTASLNLTNVTSPMNVRLILSNAGGAVTSSVATVSVRLPLFTWQPPVIISTAEATLNLPGKIVGAAHFGTPSTAITVTLANGTNVTFFGNSSVATCTGTGSASGACDGRSTGNTNFDTVLDGFKYDAGPHLITLTNLVPGRTYSVQLFALDNRRSIGTEISRAYSYQDPQDATAISATAYMGQNVYVIGTFTAPTNTLTIQQNLPTANNGNLNALVVREIPASNVRVAIEANAGNLIFSGTNADAGATFLLVASTNLSVPASNWMTLSTNQCASDGSFRVTNTTLSDSSQGFFQLKPVATP
jgi:alpha-L-fucosidase